MILISESFVSRIVLYIPLFALEPAAYVSLPRAKKITAMQQQQQEVQWLHNPLVNKDCVLYRKCILRSLTISVAQIEHFQF